MCVRLDNGLIVSTLEVEGVGKIINKSVTLLSHTSLLLLFRSCLEFETCDDVGGRAEKWNNIL